jgi:hypothetical protein
VKEQSHKSEMRAALRGDFERLRARREDGATPVAAATSTMEPISAPDAVQPVEPVVGEPVAAEAPPTRSSWLDRLRDRR